MSKRSSDSAGGGGREETAVKRRRAGGSLESAAEEDEENQQKKKVTRCFDGVSEDLIGVTLSFLGVRELEVARHACKVFSVVARRFLPLWIGVAAAAAGDSAGGGATSGLAAHVKPSLHEALLAFQRFPRAHPAGRSLEIRLLDGAAHATGWEVGPFWNRVPGKIGGGEYSGLQLDGEDRWRGLRIVTSEVDVVYGDDGEYSVFMKDGVTSIGERAFCGCTGLTSVTFPAVVGSTTAMEVRKATRCKVLQQPTPAVFAWRRSQRSML